MILLLAAAALALESAPLEECTPLPDGRVECRFRAENAERRHYRVSRACEGPLAVNGIAAGEAGRTAALSGYLQAGENRIVMAGACLPARILRTPRVYIARLTRTGEGEAEAEIENTLDNTASVTLLCAGSKTLVSITIPPNSTAVERVRGVAGGSLCRMVKETESVEDSYTFQARVDNGADPQNGTGNYH